eukprot:CAMPEP_0175534516 /NCGR_PEP_ID=MMETSP0096-20121207/23731_1 /TAXON_ID=311494 /ORGANISM="Alexandrium monilatum, Strain CCMP3105" /LENGTH=130 /DNA_ID=CAMNT_0016837299 /DNA_START=343 /DNA_END=732 /DNA_ORIENTATION=+
MSVYVCVSICEMPSIFASSARKSSSGANFLASQSLNLMAGSEVMTLKSLHPPHTTRCTSMTPSTDLIVSSMSDSAFWASSRDFFSQSSDHLHRHSRAMTPNVTPGAISPIAEQTIRRGGHGGDARLRLES